jgi:hypothetical protein
VDELKECAVLVWAFREENWLAWLTPDRRDSLRYAYSEMGEAYSEYLREVRSTDLRNREKLPELDKELTDVVIMLITAVGQEWSDYTSLNITSHIRGWDDGRILDYASLEIALALGHNAMGNNGTLNMMLAMVAIAFLLRRRGVNLLELVEEKLAKIKDKIALRSWKEATDEP